MKKFPSSPVQYGYNVGMRSSCQVLLEGVCRKTQVLFYTGLFAIAVIRLNSENKLWALCYNYVMKNWPEEWSWRRGSYYQTYKKGMGGIILTKILRLKCLGAHIGIPSL